MSRRSHVRIALWHPPWTQASSVTGVMDEADRLSVTALSVALVALIVAITQLLQQTFGTTEGYRKCRHEVIGPWAAFTRRRFVWYELRMETRFITPELDLLTPAQTQQAYINTRGPYPLIADSPENATPEMHDTLHPEGLRLGKDQSHLADELLVSWIHFLQALHTMQTGPAVAGSERHCCAKPTFNRHVHREPLLAHLPAVKSEAVSYTHLTLPTKRIV